MSNIGSFGNDKFNVNPINNVPPPAVNPPTTGGATEVPSGAITVPSTTSDQFVRVVVNSGTVIPPTIEKKNSKVVDAWSPFAVEPGTDANPVLPLALNMKSEAATIKLTELPPKGNESVTAEFMKITGTNGTNASIASRIIGALNQS